MLENNRLLPFIFTFLPALVYAAMIYFSAPYQTIGRRMSQLYFQMGVISATITGWFLWIFPEWQTPLSSQPMNAMLALTFFQIAVLEEGMKFFMFKATEQYRIKHAHPCAIMFYGMCISAGFAVMENVMYLQMYGNDVLLVRAFSAIVLHVVTGLMMGYFIALSKMDSTLNYLYQVLAMLVPVFLHGLYDFNVMAPSAGLPGHPIWMVLGPGVLVTLVMWWQLVRFNGQRVG